MICKIEAVYVCIIACGPYPMELAFALLITFGAVGVLTMAVYKVPPLIARISSWLTHSA